MEETTKSVNLNGTFRFKVDAKGRVSLPAKFRKVLDKELVVTKDPSFECLRVFEQDDFNEWIDRILEEKLGEFSESNRVHLNYRRKLKGGSADVEIDATNRILLPASQREAVGISKEVVIVGNKGYFEIWDAELYDAMDAEIDLGDLFD